MESSETRKSSENNITYCNTKPKERNETKLKLKSKRKRKSDGYKFLIKNQCPSECQVCRNPAIGYHYEVPSCNGCKIFFRRAIVNGRKVKCSKKGVCLDENGAVETKGRVCRACRLKKCIEAGMNPLAIQAEAKSEEGKVLKDELSSQTEQRELKTVINSLIVVEEDITNRIIRKLTQIEISSEPLHRSGVPAGYGDSRKLEEILGCHPVLLISDIPNLKFYPPPCYTHKNPRKRATNYIHSSFLSTIEASKMFDFSNELSLESKLILIKHTTVVCSNMMDAFFSMNDMKSDKLLHPDGSAYGEKIGNTNRFKSFQKTLISFLCHKVNKIEYLLFKAIMLCNPAVPGLSLFDQRVIEKERNEYMKSLFNYCLHQHGKLYGPDRFSSILAIAPIIENQSRNQKDLHISLDAEHDREHRKLGVEIRKIFSDSYEGILES